MVKHGKFNSRQKVDNIRLSVSNGESSSWISLSVGGIEVASDRIQFTGDVVFESDLADGNTVISGDCITTGTVSAKRIDLGEKMKVFRMGPVQRTERDAGPAGQVRSRWRWKP